MSCGRLDTSVDAYSLLAWADAALGDVSESLPLVCDNNTPSTQDVLEIN